MKSSIAWSFILVALPCLAFATVNRIDTTVVRTLSDATLYGGCAAQLAVAGTSVGLQCDNWVSFSCTGDFAPKDVARRNYDMALLAAMTGASVRVVVDDNVKVNGKCFASRIEVFAP